MQINANKITINYEVNGSGSWITLIHGATNNLKVWEHQVEALSPYFCTLAFDIRGHGKSDLGNAPVTADLLVEDVRSLFKALGISSSIVLAHSIGAELALRFYLKYPHMVDKLILCNSIAGTLLGEQEMLPFSSPNSSVNNSDKIAVYFSSELVQNRPELIERFRETVLRGVNKRSRQERLHPGIMVRELIYSPSKKSQQVHCPTLLLYGLNDPVVNPSAAEPVTKYFSDVQVKTIPTGHHSFWELPEEFNRIVLDFALNKGK